MKHGQLAIERRRAQWRRRGFLGVDGSVAVELGLVAPFLITVIFGIVDFGAYLDNSQAIAAATRIGAQYARDSATCKAGIQILSSPQVNSACTTGIQNAMQNSISFSPALTYPASFPLTCQCDDGTSITCGNNSCATAGRPTPDRVFITVSAGQAITPVLPWPGFPTALNGKTEVRLQ
jgi:Flp pilus assembly protein TadG